MDGPRINPPALITPIYQAREGMSWPLDKAFFLVAANGLFHCRNHELFVSCTPAQNFPAELVDQLPFMQLKLPRIPRRMFELVVGFFDRIYDLWRSEAIVLLGWDRSNERYRIIVPQQEAVVYQTKYSRAVPVSVRYEVPSPLQEFTPIVSIHSHADQNAYASAMDRQDEAHFPGWHIVVGRLDLEPPEFHAEGVIDGNRFALKVEQVLEGYQQRRVGVPQEWIDRVKVDVQSGGFRVVHAPSDPFRVDDPDKPATLGQYEQGSGPLDRWDLPQELGDQ